MPELGNVSRGGDETCGIALHIKAIALHIKAMSHLTIYLAILLYKPIIYRSYKVGHFMQLHNQMVTYTIVNRREGLETH